MWGELSFTNSLVFIGAIWNTTAPVANVSQVQSYLGVKSVKGGFLPCYKLHEPLLTCCFKSQIDYPAVSTDHSSVVLPWSKALYDVVKCNLEMEWKITHYDSIAKISLSV